MSGHFQCNLIDCLYHVFMYHIEQALQPRVSYVEALNITQPSLVFAKVYIPKELNCNSGVTSAYRPI